MRRHRNHAQGGGLVQDPGKDLFAYLFLLIMVFSFMLLMSSEQQSDLQKGPKKETKESSGYVQLQKGDVGRLEKKNGQLFLRYDKTSYEPLKEIDRLEKDNRITGGEENGKRILYIRKESQATISLQDYLTTFEALSSKNISIVFVTEAL